MSNRKMKTMYQDPDPELAISGGKSSHRRERSLAWLTLVLLAFFAGAGLDGLQRRFASPKGRSEVVLPATATRLPPTLTPVPTPTVAVVSGVDAIPALTIEIDPDDYAQIQAKREEALQTWILQSDASDFVDATLTLGPDMPVPVRLRLKGDWGDHFTGDKWSYRIETRGDAAIMGMRVFSLQDPSTRAYLNEWLFTENLQAEGVLSVRYGFVNGVQNGVPVGVYAVEEGFSKELLESQGRREGVIIRYDEDLMWAYWAANSSDLSTPTGVNRFHIIDEFQSGDVDADSVLAAQRDVAVGKLRAWWAGEKPFSEVFDVEVSARFWALVDLWGAKHAVQWHNLRYYYNPVTTLLEPIGFDAQPLVSGTRVDAGKLPGWLAALGADDALVLRYYAEYLWKFSQPSYLEGLQAAYGSDLSRLQTVLTPEFGDVMTPEGESVLSSPWEVLRERQMALQELLTPIQMAYAYRPADSPTSTLRLDVGNLTGFPVEILGVQAADAYLPASSEWVSPDSMSMVVDPQSSLGGLVLSPLPADARHMPYAHFEIVSDEGDGEVLAASASLQLVTRVWGMTQTVTQPVLSRYPALTQGPLPPAPTADESIARHSFLQVSDTDSHMLTIPAGTWSIEAPLVLPEGFGLSLGPGTTLQFDAESYILSRGPLVFRGTEAEPILLEPMDRTWWGIVVLGSEAPSHWDFVTIVDTDAVSLPGWMLTGGVTFYESPITLSHTNILGTRAEDAVNVIRSDFVFVETAFADTTSDAFDSDFSQGEISACSFVDISADAIDTSGSRVHVQDVQMHRVGDKAVSAGESSRLVAEALTIEDAGFGVVSKDLSHVSLEAATISGVRIAALAAYTKKVSYGPATMTAADVVLDALSEGQATLVQTGSWIDLNGQRVWGQEVDIEGLYVD